MLFGLQKAPELRTTFAEGQGHQFVGRCWNAPKTELRVSLNEPIGALSSVMSVGLQPCLSHLRCMAAHALSRFVGWAEGALVVDAFIVGGGGLLWLDPAQLEHPYFWRVGSGRIV